MFSVGDRVRVNENYTVDTDHGNTGTVTVAADNLGFIMVDIDSGNVFDGMANLYFANELDLLEDDNV